MKAGGPAPGPSPRREAVGRLHAAAIESMYTSVCGVPSGPHGDAGSGAVSQMVGVVRPGAGDAASGAGRARPVGHRHELQPQREPYPR